MTCVRFTHFFGRVSELILFCAINKTNGKKRKEKKGKAAFFGTRVMLTSRITDNNRSSPQNFA